MISQVEECVNVCASLVVPMTRLQNVFKTVHPLTKKRNISKVLHTFINKLLHQSSKGFKKEKKKTLQKTSSAMISGISYTAKIILERLGIIVCQNLILQTTPYSYSFFDISMVFPLETIGVSIMIWWLAFEKKPSQFSRDILIQVVVILLQLYIEWY